MKPSRAAVIATVILLILSPACSRPTPDEVDLSPARWPAGDLAAAQAINKSFGGNNDLAVGSEAIITGTTGEPAVRAGLEALRQGGSAVDAALVTSLTQICLAAGAWVSYAGFMTLVYYDAESGEITNLNAAYNTVLGEDDPLSIPRGSASGAEATPSGRTALVPGYMAGVQAAHDRYGRLPFAELFVPAIYLAENGFELHDLNARMLERRKEVLSRLPETRAVFTRPDDSFYEAGDLFKQPELARTLSLVAEHGVSYMYTGEWAEKLVAAVEADGGKMTPEDLARYEATWEEPLAIEHGDVVIHAHGLPAQGGVHLAETLNVAQAADLAGMGYYASSPEAFYWLHQMTNLMVLSFVPPETRTLLIGQVDSSYEGRTTPAFAEHAWGVLEERFVPKDIAMPADPKHSDAIVVIDGKGNIAAMVHTINTSTWGETGIFVDGVSIPDSASFQQTQIQEAGPGNRLPDPTQPLIVTRDGKPVAALASIGAGLHQKTTSVLINLIDRQMDIKEAIDAPSQHLPKYAPDGSSEIQVFEGDFPEGLIEQVRAMGQGVLVHPQTIEARAPRGYVVGATIDPVTGEYRAVSTKMFNARALAD